MKKNLIGIFLLFVFLNFWTGLIYAATDNTKLQSPLVFKGQPAAKNMDFNSTQQVMLVVKNMVPNVPIRINQVGVIPGTNLIGQAITNNCGNLVPAGGTCQFTVTIRSGSKAGQVSESLVLFYGERNIKITSPAFTFDIGGSAIPATLKFVIQPVFEDMVFNSRQNQTFIIQSKTNGAVAINSISLLPASTLVTEILGGTCFQGVPAGKSCTVNVRVDSGTTTGNVSQRLIVRYAGNKTLTSSPIQFAVESTTDALSFIEQESPTNMFIGDRQTLVYVVKNNSTHTVTFTRPNLTVNPISPLVQVGFGYNCAGQILAGATCRITSVLTAGSEPGNVVQQVVLRYSTAGSSGTNVIASDEYKFRVETKGAPLDLQHQGTPVDMSLRGQQSIPFIVTNTSPTDTITIQNVVATPHSSLVTETVSNNCNSTIPPHQSCQIELNITAGTQTGTVSQKLLASYKVNGGGQFVLDSKIFDFTISSGRTVRFVNQCTQPIWFGVSGGAVFSKQSPSNCAAHNTCVTTCSSDADCYANTQCIQTGGIKQCFSTNFDSSTDSYRLASGAESSIFIPIPSTDVNFQDIIWSGTFAARTGCSAGSCETAGCTNTGAATGACTPGVGFTGPNTIGEITMLRSASDTYDISLIDGFNVPMSITPSATQSTTNPFICGAAGGTTASLGLGACSWDFTTSRTEPPSPSYVYVTDNSSSRMMSLPSCTTGSCSVGFECGVTLQNMLNTASGDTPHATCGRFLGYWSSREACGLNGTIGSPFFCDDDAHMPSFPSAVLKDLYLCDAGIPSCYSTGVSNNNCCGCVNWDTVSGISMPTPPTVPNCNASTTTWTNVVLPTLEWLKQACPRAYSYPFDDKSSTFTCSNVVSAINRVDYTITFCPS